MSMTKDYSRLPPTEMRRSDRAQDDAWISRFLHHAPVGTLATVFDGQPYINTNLFVFDEARHCLYLHTAHVGRTQANVRANEKVCFSVMEMGRLLPADTAMEFSVEYAGAVVFGRARIIEDREEALYGLRLLMGKYASHLEPGTDYQPPIEDDLKYTAVYRIDIDSWSGKKKEVEADFPGAYQYANTPMLPSNQGGDSA
jgi:nitroimidazol reductase NimA-like FMN-containing flavoprotein (pyridoxamine 5'-phosphate oxidase superfamily)